LYFTTETKQSLTIQTGNTLPPVDLQTYGGGAELAYSTLDQDGAVGRFFRCPSLRPLQNIA
jgi:hypothetical protein